jgi:hypothetical protein
MREEKKTPEKTKHSPFHQLIFDQQLNRKIEVSGKIFWCANEKLINLAIIAVFIISDHTFFLVSVIAVDPHCFFP